MSMEFVHFTIGDEGGVKSKEFVKMPMFDILCDYAKCDTIRMCYKTVVYINDIDGSQS